MVTCLLLSGFDPVGQYDGLFLMCDITGENYLRLLPVDRFFVKGKSVFQSGRHHDYGCFCIVQIALCQVGCIP